MARVVSDKKTMPGGAWVVRVRSLYIHIYYTHLYTCIYCVHFSICLQSASVNVTPLKPFLNLSETNLSSQLPQASPRGAGWLFGERPTQHFNRSNLGADVEQNRFRVWMDLKLFVCLLVCWFVGLFGLFGLLVCWFVGLLVCWFVGLLVCLFVGLLVCWFVGLLVCWFVGLFGLFGLLVCWFVGLLVCWFVGLLVCWLVGLLACLLVCLFVGLLVCWFVGLLVC